MPILANPFQVRLYTKNIDFRALGISAEYQIDHDESRAEIDECVGLLTGQRTHSLIEGLKPISVQVYGCKTADAAYWFRD